MSLYKRENSAIWQMRCSVNGKIIRQSTGTSNKKLAQQIYEKTKVQVAEGKFKVADKQDMPFDRLVETFLEKHSRVEKRSYMTDESYSKGLIEYFGKKPIRTITPLDIKNWREWRTGQITMRRTPVTKATMNRQLTLLKTIFNMAVEWGFLENSPAEKIKPLKGESKRMRFLTNEEISRLVDSAKGYMKPLIIAAICTAMRRGELFGLKWSEVDLEHGFIRLIKTKNSEPRDVPISGYLSETLKNLKTRQRSDYVFCQKNGKMMSHTPFLFKSALKEAGIEDFRFHDLRHTAASLYASGGCDIITLQHLLGHKCLAMTQRYAHLMPEKHEKSRRIMDDLWSRIGDTKSGTVQNG